MEAPTNPFMMRFLSDESKDIFSEQIGVFGHRYSDALMAALMALKLAFDAGRITEEEKRYVQGQLVAGEGYEAELLKKLTSNERDALLYQFTLRAQIFYAEEDEILQAEE